MAGRATVEKQGRGWRLGATMTSRARLSVTKEEGGVWSWAGGVALGNEGKMG
jgi:hypothetical protein